MAKLFLERTHKRQEELLKSLQLQILVVDTKEALKTRRDLLILAAVHQVYTLTTQERFAEAAHAYEQYKLTFKDEFDD